MYSEILLIACPSCLFRGLLLMAGFLALGLLAGYWLWGKYKKMVGGLNTEIKGLKNKLNEREKDFASLKYAHDELEKDNGGMRSTLAGCEGDRAALQASLNRSKMELATATAAAAAAAASGGSFSTGIADDSVAAKETAVVVEETAIVEESTPVVETPTESTSSPDTEKVEISADTTTGDEIKMGASTADTDTKASISTDSTALGFASYGKYFDRDNLQIVEGVGPKISRTLQSAGITNWGELAGKSAGELETILSAANISTKINNPKTWPEQARLAHEGEWEELVKYQKFLDTGMESKGDFETPAKVEKLYLKAIGFAGAKPENLKVVEGIGPKIEGLLKAGGINNWSELANAKVAKIQDILNAAGPRYKLANPSTWPKQAGYAAAEKWSELKSYQNSLNGGR